MSASSESLIGSDWKETNRYSPVAGRCLPLEVKRSGDLWLTAALNCAADALLIVDSSGKVQFMNSAVVRLTGWEKQEAKGRSYAEILHLRHAGQPITDDLVRLAILNEGPLSLGNDITLEAKDGEFREIEAEIAPANLGEITPESVIFTFRDVGQRKWDEYQRRQEHAIRAVERLAETTTHALNNLLTTVIGNSELLMSRQDLSPEHRELVSSIQTGACGIAQVVRQLSAISRVKFATRRPIQLNETVRAFIPRISPLFGNGVELVSELDPELLTVSADAGQMEQVLFALLSNAREAIAGGGTVCISTRIIVKEAEALKPPRTFVCVAVRDTGEGMSPETRERIFEPFFTTKKEGGHAGLGLCIAQGTIRDYRGFLDVQSAAGEGTAVEFGIPAMERDTFTYLDETDVSPGMKTVLIVEDDHAVRQLLRRILENNGYRAVEARDGEDALLVADLHQGRIDVLLTGIGMPGMSGLELVRRIAETRPEAKFLLISGYSPDRIGHAANLPRGVDFLQKPFQQKELLQHIDSLLSVSHR